EEGHLLGLLQDLDQAPPLGPRQGPRLDDPHQIALTRLVPGVVHVQGAGAADDLLVLRMPPGDLDLDRDGLVGLAWGHASLPGLAAGGLAVGGRRSGAGFMLGPALAAVGSPLRRGPLAPLAASGRALLRALLRTWLGRLPGSLQTAASLPVEAFHRVA